jgi:CMP-N,N'-diacetyllegionaminic acid synthase
VSVLALVPARSGSKGIPGKNFRELAGLTPVRRVVNVAIAARCEDVVVTSDAYDWFDAMGAGYLKRPDSLAQDDTPMIDVVKHALTEIHGAPGQIVLLLQPTQPLREPKHLQAAVALLRESQADSVVSVVALPRGPPSLRA